MEDLGVDGKIILKLIIRKWGGETWPRLLWLRIGTVAGTCERGNKSWSSVKCGKITDYMGTC